MRPMNGKPFLDTNILVYATMPSDPRCSKARELTRSGGVISVQVLNEFANVAHKKIGRSWQEIEGVMALFLAQLDDPVPLTLATSTNALCISRMHNVSIYDALIVAAALEARCQILLTEDLQHLRKFETLQVVNPFVVY
jgi:predicted nucleic acid-binding protein